MALFSWTQLMTFEQDALRRRVPLEVPGLTPLSRAPNNKFFGSTVGFGRNGSKSLLNHRFSFRIGLFGYMTTVIYQVWRIPTWGYVQLVEHHNFSWDNIVYDKLSTRSVPYHAVCSVL